MSIELVKPLFQELQVCFDRIEGAFEPDPAGRDYRFRDLLTSDTIKYVAYLAAVDGILVDREREYLGALIDQEISEKQMNLINERYNFTDAEARTFFVLQPMKTFLLCLWADKTFSALGEASAIYESLSEFYRKLGIGVITVDGEVSMDEANELKSFLAALDVTAKSAMEEPEFKIDPALEPGDRFDFIPIGGAAEEAVIPVEAPVAEEAVIPEEIPVEEIAIPEETPAEVEIPIEEVSPVLEEAAPLPEEIPVPEEMPVLDEVPIPEEIPMPEEMPVADEMPIPEEPLITEEIAVAEEPVIAEEPVAVPEEIFNAEETPVLEETPVIDEVPVVEEVPTAEEAAPIPEDIPVPEEMPVADEMPIPEEPVITEEPIAEEIAVSEEPVIAEEPVAVPEEIFNAEEIPVPEEAPVEEAVTTEEIPAVAEIPVEEIPMPEEIFNAEEPLTDIEDLSLGMGEFSSEPEIPSEEEEAIPDDLLSTEGWPEVEPEEESFLEPMAVSDMSSEVALPGALSVEDVFASVSFVTAEVVERKYLEISIGENGSSYIAIMLSPERISSLFDLTVSDDMPAMIIGNQISIGNQDAIFTRNLLTGDWGEKASSYEIVAGIDQSIIQTARANQESIQTSKITAEALNCIFELTDEPGNQNRINEILSSFGSRLCIRCDEMDHFRVFDQNNALHSIAEALLQIDREA